MSVFETRGALHPVNHSEMIVHRSEFDQILTHIETEDHYLALGSPRQTGKTTLLFQVKAQLHGHGYGVAYLSLEILKELEKADFYQELCAALNSELGDMVEGELPLEKIGNQVAFSRYLTQLSIHTPQARKLILILDEIEGVPETVGSTFFPTLRHFFHQGRGASAPNNPYQKVMFIFSGVLGLHRLALGENSPLLNICEPISHDYSLRDFSKEQVGELTHRLEGFSPEIVEVSTDSIYEWCDGHPYLTQRLCQLIEENPGYKKAGTRPQLQDAVKGLVRTHFAYNGNDPNLRHIFNHLRDNAEYKEQVLEIVTGERRTTVPLADELLLLGVIKRTGNGELQIRNPIYDRALNQFFFGGDGWERDKDGVLVIPPLQETEKQGFLNWAGAPQTILAIVFTDVVGSTKLGNLLGDDEMNRVRRAHFIQARKLIKEHRGYEIKTIGDAFMVAFRTATDGLKFALALHNQTGHEQISIRVGLHVGQVSIEEDDAFGAMVNYTARVEKMAKGAEIWVSAEAKSYIDAVNSERERALQWEAHPERELDGFPGKHTLWSVALDTSDSPTKATDYNTATIRKLLIAAFSDSEFTAFCFDYFEDVDPEFSHGMSKADKVQRLLEHAKRNNAFPALLQQVKEANSAMYDQFEPRLINKRKG